MLTTRNDRRSQTLFDRNLFVHVLNLKDAFSYFDKLDNIQLLFIVYSLLFIVCSVYYQVLSSTAI